MGISHGWQRRFGCRRHCVCVVPTAKCLALSCRRTVLGCTQQAPVSGTMRQMVRLCMETPAMARSHDQNQNPQNRRLSLTRPHPTRRHRMVPLVCVYCLLSSIFAVLPLVYFRELYNQVAKSYHVRFCDSVWTRGVVR